MKMRVKKSYNKGMGLTLKARMQEKSTRLIPRESVFFFGISMSWNVRSLETISQD
jgi:hypothetical protein